MGGSDLLVRDLVVVVEEIELCERRSLVSLGGFGSGLRCDSSNPLGVLLKFETFGICSESDELSLSSRPNGDCCGESMLVVIDWSRERESSGLKNDDVLVLVHVLALVLGLISIFRKP